MKRALKSTAPDPLAETQEPLLFFSETATLPDAEKPATRRQPVLRTRPTSFYDEDGRFVPRCACGAYASFGIGVSLRHGREGTWWCGPCWRNHGNSEATS